MRKKDIINMIRGVDPPRDHEYSIFTGNQWNEDWEWDRDKLNELTAPELYAFYTYLTIKEGK